MRLTDQQRSIIRSTARACYGKDATVLLFGSRLDDRRRRGHVPALQAALTFTDVLVSTRAALAAWCEARSLTSPARQGAKGSRTRTPSPSTIEDQLCSLGADRMDFRYPTAAAASDGGASSPDSQRSVPAASFLPSSTPH